MKTVYICAPYRGDVARNIEKSKDYGCFAIEKGFCPFIPHIHYPTILDDNKPEERKLGLQLDLEWILKSDEVWTFGSEMTEGMKLECNFAMEHGIKILSFSEDMEFLRVL